METKRILEAKGKLEFVYDYKHDVLTFKIKDRNYKQSFEFQNFVIDIDDKDFVTGARVFDASKVFNIEKLNLLSIFQAHLKADIIDNAITLILNFNVKIRNRIIPLFSEKQNFTQQFTTPITSAMQSSIKGVVA